MTQKRQKDWQVLTKEFTSYTIRYKSLTLWVRTLQNGQTHSNNSLATADDFVGFALKALRKIK